jgi:hypothetical protein
LQKAFILAALIAAIPAAASAQNWGSRNQNSGSNNLYGTGSNPSSTYVAPSIRSDGGMTSGHYRSTPNNTQFDNYGTRGNQNPYTGQTGTRSPRW